jgi:hypothetical protein
VKRIISPRDLAEAIGVPESALATAAAEGRLAIARTAGGHRRITIAEATRFIRASGATVVCPELLGLPEISTDETRHGEDELYAHLYEGRGREARGFLLRRYLGGESIAALADGPIRGAMSRLGELWKHDARGIFVEHRATDCCIQAVTALRSLVEPPDDAPVALGGAPSGDPYLLPSMIATLVLTEEGMRPVNLGADTPIASLRLAIAAHRPVLAWMSCSTPVGPDLAADLLALATELHAEGVAFGIGARCAPPLDPSGHATALDTMQDLAALARAIVARSPAPPG